MNGVTILGPGNGNLVIGGGIRIFGGGAVAAPAGPTGAYDDVVNLVHSYGMHLHKTAYAGGNIVRIRRTSDSVEQDFSYDSSGDVDTAAIATFLGGSSGVIVTEYDQIGSVDATMATAGKQALYVASGKNGKPMLQADGVDDDLKNAAFTTLSNVGAHSRLIVAETVDTSNRIVVFAGGADGALQQYGGFVAFNTYAAAGKYAHDGTVPGIAWHLVVSRFDGSGATDADKLQFFKNGAQKTLTYVTPPMPTTTGANSNLALLSANGAAFWKGGVGDILIANAAWSTAEREAAEAAANSYWSIY